MKTYDAGSAIILEVKTEEHIPHEDIDELFDPITIKVTITDPDNTVVVNNQSMTKSSIGKYYYIIQSTVVWIKGRYKVQINAATISNADVTVGKQEFQLV